MIAPSQIDPWLWTPGGMPFRKQLFWLVATNLWHGSHCQIVINLELDELAVAVNAIEYFAVTSTPLAVIWVSYFVIIFKLSQQSFLLGF